MVPALLEVEVAYEESVVVEVAKLDCEESVLDELVVVRCVVRRLVEVVLRCEVVIEDESVSVVEVMVESSAEEVFDLVVVSILLAFVRQCSSQGRVVSILTQVFNSQSLQYGSI